MPDLPTSIDVWACPTCGALSDHGVIRHHGDCGDFHIVSYRYVLAEATDEMVERAMWALIGPHGGHQSPEALAGWRLAALRALSAAFSTQEERG